MLEKDRIAALIPHAGAMCLIERVTGWDKTAITCETTTHRDPANPLRSRGILPVTSGIEYAAQAMAIHGRVNEGGAGKPRLGYLASIRNVKFHAARLDDLDEALIIHAEQLIGEEGRVIYQFSVSAGSRLLLAGRTAVVLEAAA